MNDVDVAIAVVCEGARLVRDRVGMQTGRIEKGAGDFATTVDLQAEQAMIAVLRRERPSDAVLAEESGASGAVGASRRWLLDPLCGTLNYAARMRVVAVNAALRDGEEVVCAAVGDPFSGEVFWTDGQAAMVRADGRDALLVPSAASRLVDLNLDPPFPSVPAFRAVSLLADPEFVASFRPRVVSSSLAMCWVATGQRAAYITDGDLRDSVHFAAGLAICETARCCISDLHGDRWGGSPAGAIVAADHETHAILVRLAGKQQS